MAGMAGMDAVGLGTPLITMNRAKKTIKIVDRYQQRYPWLAFPIGVWKKFNDDQAGNLAALRGSQRRLGPQAVAAQPRPAAAHRRRCPGLSAIR